MIFEGTVGSSYDGDIALDDIKLVQGGDCAYFNSTTTTTTTTPARPPSAFQCDFEGSDTNFCLWFPDPSSDIVFTIKTGQNAVYGSAPFIDHTLQNSFGRFAYLNTKSNDQKLRTSRLRSPLLQWNFETCLEFWYQLAGPSVAALMVGVRTSSSVSQILWKRLGNLQADTWQHSFVRIPANSTNKFIDFEADVSGTNQGYIAIDDVQLILGACPAQKTCDFESPDICGYTHDVTAKFKWERNRGGTSSSSTGASSDHTYQTPAGYYMYIETSSPQMTGDKARLISPTYKRHAGGVCVTWWYHAYGSSIGSLNVYSREKGQLSVSPLWSISGNQGDMWRTASITVNTIHDFEMVFEGVVGTSFTGDISLDDITIDTDGPCIRPGSCTFETSLCNWSPIQLPGNKSVNMLRISPQQLAAISPSSVQTGFLDVDTTTNTKYGHFLWMGSGYYTVNTSVANNLTSQLMSETFMAQYYIQFGGCLSFMYQLNGPNAGSVQVSRKLYSYQNTVMWRMDGDQGKGWKQAKVPLQSPGDNFELFIDVALLNNGLNSNVAIDDVNVYTEDCSNIPVGPSPTDPFDCGDGTKVTQAQVCDFKQDCANNKDESDCADCDFEKGSCNWYDVSVGSMIWERARADAAAKNNSGPPVDHTTGAPIGHYLFVDSNVGFYDEAELLLQKMLQPSSPTCEIEFYYHMLGDTDDIVVYLAEGYPDFTKTNIFELYGDKGDKWNRALVRLGRVAKPFRLMMAAERYWLGDSDVAIDDIKLRNCEFPPVRPQGCINSDYFYCARKACVSNRKVCDLGTFFQFYKIQF